EVAPPGWRVVWYSRSTKLARSRLKPVVLVLARLLEMTAMRVCCASRPVLAIHRAWVMAGFRQSGWARSARGQQGVGRAGGFVTALQDPYLYLELARQFDHRDQHPSRVDVAAFAHARGQDLAVGRRERPGAGRQPHQLVLAAHQVARGRRRDLQLAEHG